MQQSKKALLLISALSVLILLLSQCVDNGIASSDPRGPAFAGSAQCRKCHQSIYDNYAHSAHFNTTQPADAKNVRGSLDAPDNKLSFNDSTYVQVQQRDSGLFQAAYVYGKETEAHRMDILFGIKHAQTFLYWNGDRTFEHPVSYYTKEKLWGTSPGFSAAHVNFTRFIGANCFECHSAYIGSQLNASTAGIEEMLKKNTLVYGIDCERCHGPANDHVNFQNENPNSKEAKHIVRMASLSRQQKLDVCAMCHSGNNKMSEKSTFRFRPGDTLANFFVIWPTGDTNTNFDVHGNQYQLLMQSKCFIKSNMDCSTCHNAHTDAATDAGMYATACKSCHKGVKHSFAIEPAQVQALQDKCVSCHMPYQPSRAITFQLAGSEEKAAYQLRTHKIAIYK